MKPTGKALVEHWDWAANHGLMNKSTATSFRVACSQVLGIDDGWQETDVSTLDVETQFTRFQNLRAKDFKPASLSEYKRRFRQALKLYLDYVKDPASWQPQKRDRPTRQKVNGKQPSSSDAASVDSGRARVVRHGGADASPASETLHLSGPVEGTAVRRPEGNLFEYHFPLREGTIIRLILPIDLKAREVKRLAAFMSTLAVDYAPAEDA